MFGDIRKKKRREKGFTLIELLVVIIIIAILAAIAIPIFLGQRQRAQDVAAKALVRNVMTVVESAYADTHSFSVIVVADLNAIEPMLTFVIAPNAATAPTAAASANTVNVSLTGVNTYEVGTVSLTSKTFGFSADKGPGGGTTFYVGGVAKAW